MLCVPSKGLQSEINSKIFSDLMRFIKRAHEGKSAERIKNTVIHEIPTAALITGDLFWFQCIFSKQFPFIFVDSGLVLENTDVGLIFFFRCKHARSRCDFFTAGNRVKRPSYTFCGSSDIQRLCRWKALIFQLWYLTFAGESHVHLDW